MITVDSRLADTAGLIFLDLDTDEGHFVPLPTSFGSRRNGFRGGVVKDGRLLVCTSHAVFECSLTWSQTPKVEILRRIFRPEWLMGQRAHADLHAVHIERGTGQLIVANSFFDSLDYFDAGGQFERRDFLWDLSPRIKGFAAKRKAGVADLCHVNSIFEIGGEVVLTLGNLNGSRRGAFMNLRDGSLYLTETAFPHDGHHADGQLFFTESEAQCISLVDNVKSVADLQGASPRSTRIDVSEHGRTWIRGLTLVGEEIVVGCSQFSETDAVAAKTAPTHLRIFDRKTLTEKRRVKLPESAAVRHPVIYSIIPLD